ncbi:MAG: hypothetical protein RSA70_01355 [Clostridia bacterium]
MKKLSEIIIIAFAALAIFTVCITSFLLPKEKFSLFENRAMAVAPLINKNDLLSGNYFKSWDNYLNDHVAFRESMLKINTALQVDVLKKPVVFDTVIAGDTLLPFMGYPKIDYAALSGKIDSMVQEISTLNGVIEGYGGRMLYVGIPEQRSVFRERYPRYMDDDSARLNFVQDEFFAGLTSANVPSLDMAPVFKESGGDGQFSKIDHHFTFLGAYDTYKAIAAKLSLTPAQIEIKSLPNPYYGSRNRKLYNTFKTDEKLQVGYPKERVDFTRVDNGVVTKADNFKIPKNEHDPVTYTVYMGGDVAETVIKTGRHELPNMLIFGDSFTNPLESMLYLNCNEMRSIDLRHYKDMTITEYIKKYKPDIVIYVRDDSSYYLTGGNGTLR